MTNLQGNKWQFLRTTGSEKDKIENNKLMCVGGCKRRLGPSQGPEKPV